jgi:hypothetical protein
MTSHDRPGGRPGSLAVIAARRRADLAGDCYESKADVSTLRSMRLQATIVVKTTLERAWTFFGDPHNLACWDRSVARVVITSPPPYGLGTTFDTFGPAPPGREGLRTSYEITRIEEPRRTDVRVTHSNVLAHATWETRLDPEEGGTRVTCVADFGLKPMYWLLAPILRLLSSGAMLRDLGYLKLELERDSLVVS